MPSIDARSVLRLGMAELKSLASALESPTDPVSLLAAAYVLGVEVSFLASQQEPGLLLTALQPGAGPAIR